MALRLCIHFSPFDLDERNDWIIINETSSTLRQFRIFRPKAKRSAFNYVKRWSKSDFMHTRLCTMHFSGIALCDNEGFSWGRFMLPLSSVFKCKASHAFCEYRCNDVSLKLFSFVAFKILRKMFLLRTWCGMNEVINIQLVETNSQEAHASYRLSIKRRKLSRLLFTEDLVLRVEQSWRWKSCWH